MTNFSQRAVSNVVLLILLLLISAVFLWMVKPFLMTLFLAALSAALVFPLYQYLQAKLKQKQGLAAGLTILILFLVVLLPLMFLLIVVTGEAIDVSQSVTPWVRNSLAEPSQLWLYLEGLPFYQELYPYREMLLENIGGAVSFASKFLVSRLSDITLGAVNFLFLLFVFLYSLFFLLIDGKAIVMKILYYLPLEDKDERKMLNRFTSVTLATVKGTFLIGLLQGFLNGLAFALAGIPNAVFWGVFMAVLSIIPSVGSALIWIPAALYLFSQGAIVAGIVLLIFCGVVVGSLDNILRPRLVGKDTELHELMIFFSTLGGLILFGFVGIIIGPIIASLFVTIWSIYGETFKAYLPKVED